MILSENEVAAEQRETRCPCEGNREGNETGERRRNNSSVGRSVLGCDQGRAFGPGLAATVKRRKFQTRQGWPRMPSGGRMEGSRLLGVTLLVRNEWAWLWALPTFNRQNTENHHGELSWLTELGLGNREHWVQATWQNIVNHHPYQ